MTGRALAALLVAAGLAAGQEADVEARVREVLDGLAARLPERPAPADVLDAARVGIAEESVVVQAAPTIERALGAARAALVAEQDEAGTWGGSRSPLPGQEFWSNPYTHEAWTVATTGLVVTALLESPSEPALDAALARGLEALADAPVPPRPSDWDVDNTWGLIYGLHGMAAALGAPDRVPPAVRARLAERAATFVASLDDYQTPHGGWGYYAFETRARRPSWATSFMTAAAILALLDARAVGVDVPAGMIERAVDGLAGCRLPNGAYSYDFRPIPRVGLESIDDVRGSLSRIQVGNDALWAAGHPAITVDVVTDGLDLFFEHHRFLDVARRKPIPHEAYHANSGYFYFFGHYYAARLVERLEPAQRAAYATRLAREIVKTQEVDGTMWDYPLFRYDTAYGTAFGVMTLQRALDAIAPVR